MTISSGWTAPRTLSCRRPKIPVQADAISPGNGDRVHVDSVPLLGRLADLRCVGREGKRAIVAIGIVRPSVRPHGVGSGADIRIALRLAAGPFLARGVRLSPHVFKLMRQTPKADHDALLDICFAAPLRRTRPSPSATFHLRYFETRHRGSG